MVKSVGNEPPQRSVTYEFTLPKGFRIDNVGSPFLIDSAGRRHRFTDGSIGESNRGKRDHEQRFSATFDVPADYRAATLHVDSYVIDIPQNRIRRTRR